MTFYLSRDPHSRPMTYLMCACACVWVCTLMNLRVSKSRGRRRKEGALTVLNSSPGKLGLSCLLSLLSVSLTQLLFLHCDSFKLSQSFLFLPTPLLHLFSLKMHVVLVCVPDWSQIYSPVSCAGVVAMHHHAKCYTVDWVIDRLIDWLIDWSIDWSEVLETESRVSPMAGWCPSTELCLGPFITQKELLIYFHAAMATTYFLY